MSIADLRRSYTLAGLRRIELESDPIRQFRRWFQQTLDAQLLEPTAMTLATVDQAGRPSARVVLLKGVEERGFIFFTNYAKGVNWRKIQTRPWCFIGPNSNVK